MRPSNPERAVSPPRASASAEQARRIALERVMAMAPLERAELALRLGRRSRELRELALAHGAAKR